MVVVWESNSPAQIQLNLALLDEAQEVEVLSIGSSIREIAKEMLAIDRLKRQRLRALSHTVNFTIITHQTP